MIVTLTGAYRNVGDHLIGDRAHKLLANYLDPNIVNICRNEIRAETYEQMNKASAVILCGGPAYQKTIYPEIYPLDLDRLKTRVIPFGLGWKGTLIENPSDFTFTPESSAFVKSIHEAIEYSSCRDPLTQQMLANLGMGNVQMTGCPAWYDLDHIDKEFGTTNPRRVIFSDPARVSTGSFDTLRLLNKKFPESEKVLALHHGYYPRLNKKGVRFAAEHIALATYARSLGFTVQNISADLEAMKALYDEGDLHVGYRVHAHIYCLSTRTPSLLVAEDSRGVGQSMALGHRVLKGNDSTLSCSIEEEIDAILESGGDYFLPSLQAMQIGFRTMTNFLHSFQENSRP